MTVSNVITAFSVSVFVAIKNIGSLGFYQNDTQFIMVAMKSMDEKYSKKSNACL